MRHKIEASTLRHQPLVTVPELSRHHGVGRNATLAAAKRLGIEPHRRPNGHELLTFAQAELVTAELTKKLRAREDVAA